MPRTQSVAYYACELCRQRKRKCDGDGLSPCKACRDGGADCVYLRPTRVAKADLREELAKLQAINSDNSVLLDAISSRKTSPAQLNDILQRLSNGHSRADVAEMLTQSPGSRDRDPDSHDRDKDISSYGGSSTSVRTSVSNPDTLLSSQDGLKSPSLKSPSLESPSRPVSAPTPPKPTSPTHSHVQANLSYYRSQLPQLLDFVLAQDCLSFCPISKTHLTRDLESGSGQHCSPALLDALLALATVLARKKMMAMVAPRARGGGDDDVRQGHLGDAFAQEAISALYNGSGLPQRIADIQAVGVLALYCLSCEKMMEGMSFAGDFSAAIAEQWEASPVEPTSVDRQAHASLYCAAISFNRLLFLIQDHHKMLDEMTIKVGLDMSPLRDSSSTDNTISKTSLSRSIMDDAYFMRDLSLLPNSPKVIAAKLFEFTEWVYKSRYLSENSFDQAVKVYQDGLQWYESFFRYTSGCSGETHLILFAHTCYQFGIMCLLTPYVLESAAIASDGTLPMVACRQAAENIKQLIQHYRRLYKDGQLLGFMPFFRATALACLEICDTKMSM